MNGKHSPELQQRRIHYAGRVQGVGFRYQTLSVARCFAVTGYVQNMNDGRVRLVVEGMADELDRFLEAVSQRLGHYIRDYQEEVLPAERRCNGFEVRR